MHNRGHVKSSPRRISPSHPALPLRRHELCTTAILEISNAIFATEPRRLRMQRCGGPSKPALSPMIARAIFAGSCRSILLAGLRTPRKTPKRLSLSFGARFARSAIGRAQVTGATTSIATSRSARLTSRSRRAFSSSDLEEAVNSCASAGACGRGPSPWRAWSAPWHSSAPPSDSQREAPTSRGTAPASGRSAFAGAASAI